MEEELLEFAEEDDSNGFGGDAVTQQLSILVNDTWKVLIVDDEKDMHTAFGLMLGEFRFMGKPLKLLSAFSKDEACKLLEKEDDVAVMFLDVVMETSDSGLQVVKHVRESLSNSFIRIVLHTGQPGTAPEEEVVLKYDINDYKVKGETTFKHIFTTLVASLRAYAGLKTIEYYRHNLEEQVIERTKELEDVNRKLKEANRELAKLATTDSLTGCNNRFFFNLELEQEVNRSLRYASKLSLVILDIDHFKQVNDTFGHEAGDVVLRAISDILKERLRQNDLLARWGGEEFIVLLPQTGLKDATVVAEHLRKYVEMGVFPRVGTVTSSFGVAELNADDTKDILVARADAALYESKRNGRNRVTSA